MSFSWSAHVKIYWKCLHVMCLCFAGKDDYRQTTDESVKAMHGFLYLFADLNPITDFGKWMKNFMEMNDEVKKELKQIKSLETILKFHSPQPVEFYIDCRKKPEVSLSEWSWMLHEYVNYKRISRGENVIGMTLQTFKQNYTMSRMSKDQWGRPMWFVIHTYALYSSPVLSKEQKFKFKAFFSSFQFVLPCPICKEHIKENLIKYKLDPSLETNMTFFDWTVQLHNSVNRSTNKGIFTLNEAKNLYTTKDGSNGSENGLLERIFL